MLEVWVYENVWEDLKSISKKHYPNEASSLLIGEESAEKIAVVKSVESEHEFESPTAFKVDPGFLVDTIDSLEDQEMDLVGFFHSHPDLAPYVSPRDEKFMKRWNKKVWLIAGVGSDKELGEVKAFRWGDSGPKELEIKLVQ